MMTQRDSYIKEETHSNGVTSFKCSKRNFFLVDAEVQDMLKVFKNIMKSGIHRVATHTVVFPCAYAITCILKHVDFGNMYICNAKGESITSFQLADLENFYHLEKGTQNLDEELLSGFKCMTKELFSIWYKPDKSFKHRLIGRYPTTTLRIHINASWLCFADCMESHMIPNLLYHICP
jgi:hypothetical protein